MELLHSNTRDCIWITKTEKNSSGEAQIWNDKVPLSKQKQQRSKKKWYFVTKIVLTYCEKKLSWWSRKTFEIQGWRPRIFRILEITWTIYSNCERSEQFLVTECFFNLFLEISQISKNRTIIIQIGKSYSDLETCTKSFFLKTNNCLL